MLDTLFDDGSTSGLQIDVTAATAGLSHLADLQVIEAVHDLDHPVTQEELDGLVRGAQDADAHRTAAEVLQHEQAKAAEDGNFARAHDLQHDALYELHAAADAGGQMGTSIVDAEKEGAALDNADWQQHIAHDAAHDAMSYAHEGDLSNAASYAHAADDHASTAADYGHAADPGVSTAAHDHTADTSHDASATTEG